MSRRLYLERDEDKIPPGMGHAAFCRWLHSRGCLKVEHRRCMNTYQCVAAWTFNSGQPWRYQKRDNAEP